MSWAVRSGSPSQGVCPVGSTSSCALAGRYEDAAMRAAWEDRMAARRHVYHSVVERLEHDGGLAPIWDIDTATDLVWALTSWQLWEQLVVEQGWSKDQYRDHLSTLLRRTLLAEPTPGS